jgi:hypothetical protein
MGILSREIGQDVVVANGPWKFQIDQDDLGIREGRVSTPTCAA